MQIFVFVIFYVSFFFYYHEDEKTIVSNMSIK